MTTTKSHSDATPRRWSRLDILAAALPILIILTLLGIYLAAPGFYLRWVLQEQMREAQAVEFATTLSGLTAGVLLLIAAWKHWRWTPGPLAWSPALPIAVIGLATLGFIGEEISWGQTYLQWATPQSYQAISGETNLHNADLPISLQGLGSLFLILAFFGLPIAWKLERLPAGWRAAVPEWPVVWAMGVAFAWKAVKNIYRTLVDIETSGTRTGFYWDFVEQINEHKELLVAAALLLYGLYRLADLRRSRHDHDATPPETRHAP